MLPKLSPGAATTLLTHLFARERSLLHSETTLRVLYLKMG